MAEYETVSGLVVSHRGVMPRDNPPNAGGPGPNNPPRTVGPTSSEGYGNTHVLYDANLPAPFGASSWSGWPVDWYPPGGPGGWFASRTSTVGTCADTIGRSCCEFPPRVVRAGYRLDPQPYWTTNPEPALYGNFDEWLKTAINSLLLRGEMILAATARNADAYPVRWVTLNPDFVNVELIDGRLRYALGTEELDPLDICHVKYQSTPGNVRGIAPLDWIARNLLGADALERYGADLASRGGIPWGVLTHPGTLQSGQAETLRDQWLEAQISRGSAPAILSGGMKLEALSLSPESMLLLSLREFDEQRIAAAFGVPPMYVGLPQPSGLNYTSSEMLADFFYRSTLKPMVKNIGDGLSQWALPRGTDVYFDASEYLQPPLQVLIPALVQAASVVDAATGEPALTAAELRAVLQRLVTGLPVSSNLVGVAT